MTRFATRASIISQGWILEEPDTLGVITSLLG
jgi:hypothetical protein